MDIIVRNIHDQVDQQQVQKFFRPVLAKFGINFFECQKLKSRGCATLTIGDITRAQRFLLHHGQRENGLAAFKFVRFKLYLRERPVYCCQSTKTPDQYVILALQKSESDRYASSSKQVKVVPPREDGAPGESTARSFTVTKLRIGQWVYVRRNLTFASHHCEERNGRIIFGPRAVHIKLSSGVENAAQQLEIPYDSIEYLCTWNNPPSLTLSLLEAPQIYEEINTSLAQALLGLMRHAQLHQFKRKRVSALNENHERVVSYCRCYRVSLTSANDVRSIRAFSKSSPMPDDISWHIGVVNDTGYAAEAFRLNRALADGLYTILPFDVAFQLQRLVQNGYLLPSQVSRLLPHVFHRLGSRKSATVASAVRHLADSVPFVGPGADAEEFSLPSLLDTLRKSENSVLEDDPYATRIAAEYDHMMMVYKARVTPTSIYLNGPFPEIKNRVLRKYSGFGDCFLSVSFAEEDGGVLKFDRLTSSEDIYHVRFKTVLESTIVIAGRGYEFLGFSHSSLREQTCWFMAPFTFRGNLLYARGVIRQLGDFSAIRSPAKCAARIGQAFSQTLSSIAVSPDAFIQIPDIERNGRTFSDGVGTCSEMVLKKIWEGYRDAQLLDLKPTIFQIRCKGAKGVISFDKRLQGEQVCLRPSMTKFEGSPDMDIEICGSARKPLPMYLNRQLIKILEDLRVPLEPFLQLQREAVEQLRITTLSPVNASTFLERNRVSTAADLPWLVRKLYYIGLDFDAEPFLRDTLELAVLIQLREIKHRSRILVKGGWTLYGIMDETEHLRENEIYCAVNTDQGMQTLTGNMVITRCPALHPGDVQCVTAVDVPECSPLRALHNMVVFSSYGERDLPSQLSGGDLDGDLYNIIWDQSLYPKRLCTPADYHAPQPLDIGRTVERPDITDFFVNFMKSDNLGLIATLHQILADQKEEGTLNPECIQLAALHSTAVDFSKSGIPVDRLTIPRFPRARPDFQAPGPHTVIQKDIKVEDIKELDAPDESDELNELSQYGPRKILYYESQKILGELYRDIDEAKFFEKMQAQSRSKKQNGPGLIDSVWEYVRHKTLVFQWRHHLDWARGVKENYEDSLIDIILANSPHHAHPIDEIEVFSGGILGRGGSQSKRQRDLTVTMKDHYNRNVRYITDWIRRGDDDDDDGALERSIACLYIGSQEPARSRKKVGVLRSFVWVAAAVCLGEVEKLVGS